MRTLVLAVVLLVTASPCRGEFDAAGVASAKPKASGATFGDGLTSKRPVERKIAILRLKNLLIIDDGDGLALVVNYVNRVRTPRTHRPANIPTLPYVENPQHISPERVHGGIQ